MKAGIAIGIALFMLVAAQAAYAAAVVATDDTGTLDEGSLVIAPAPTEENIGQADAELVEGTGGTAPDSLLYGLDVALDRISMLLTFDPAKKARRGLQIAHERLLEAKTMAEQGKLQEAETAEAEAEAMAEEAAEAAEAIEEDGSEEVAEDAVGEAAEIEEETAGLRERAGIAKDMIKERVRARLVAAGLSEEQKAKLQAVFERIEAHLQTVKDRVAEKKAMAKLKMKAVAEMTGEEVEELTARIEADTGISEKRRQRAQRMIARAKRALSNASEELGAIEGVEELGTQVAEVDEAAVGGAEGLAEADNDDGAAEVAEQAKNFGQEMRGIARSLREAKESGTFKEVKRQLIERARSIHITVLERVLERAPEESQQSISGVITRARERLRENAEAGVVPEGASEEDAQQRERAQEEIGQEQQGAGESAGPEGETGPNETPGPGGA